MPRTKRVQAAAPLDGACLPLDEARAVLDQMEAPPPPVPVRPDRRCPAPKDPSAIVYHHADDETGRKYRVEYLVGSNGTLARVRGRVALTLRDLPPELRQLPKLRPDGKYEHVYVRHLTHVKDLTDDSKTEWYQPMFKKRWTRIDEHGNKASGVTWYARLGSYWDEAVAAVAAELAIQRYGAGASREEVETVEADLIQMAREYASAGAPSGGAAKRGGGAGGGASKRKR